MTTITERNANGDATWRTWTQGMPATAGRYYVVASGETRWYVCDVEAQCFYIAGVERDFSPEEAADYLFSPIADPPPLPEGWGA